MRKKKEMRRIFSITILLSLLLFTNSCQDWLDIRPENDVVLEDFWKNEGHVNEVLATCYRSMQEVGFMDRMLIYGELRSDNVTYGRDMPESMFRLLNIDISNSNVYCHWGVFYSTINYCNTWLYYAPDVINQDPNFTQTELRNLTAEVLTIRSLAYFYLVRAFEEVPWVDQPSIDDTQNFSLAKSTEEEVLNHLKEDLTLALSYAREKFDIEDYNTGRITKNTIRALLADISLWELDYNACVQYCDQILVDPSLELVEGEEVLYEVFYRGNSSETIFELQFDQDVQNNQTVYNFYGGAGRTTGGNWTFPAVLLFGDASPFLYTTTSGIEGEDDLRKKDFLFYSNFNEFFPVFKYAGVQRIEDQNERSTYYYRSNTANWIVYRLSDIMLMKAEALVEIGSNEQEVMNIVNTTFLRSNPDLEGDSLRLEDYNSKIELSKLVLRERQRELMFEGKRWFDLMRLARREDSTSPLLGYMLKKFSSGNANAAKMSVMESLYLPIHIDELNANSLLEQNSFYDLNTGSSTIN